MSHNQFLVAIFLTVIFALFFYLFYRTFFASESSSPEAHAASSADVGQIEETLKKILSQTSTIGPTSVGGIPPEVEKLKADLEVSQKMVDELKVRTQDGGADNTPELLAKIKILEDRLTEYEIIEDDIADLSVYKEENAKLKRQLDAIKAGASSPMVEDFAAAVENAPVGTEVRGEEVAEAVAASDALDRAVEPTVADIQPEPEPAPTPAAAAPATKTVVAPDENVPGTTDVFAEFQGDENKDILSELGDIDADRMLEEIKDLGDGMSADANVLDEEVDLEKMAKETTKG